MTAPAVMQSRPGCLSPAVPDSQHAASGAGLSLSQHSLVLRGRDGTGGTPGTIRGGQQRDVVLAQRLIANKCLSLCLSPTVFGVLC